MWRESFPVSGAFDDDLVAGVGQAIQHAVAQDGVIEETQPFVCSFLWSRNCSRLRGRKRLAVEIPCLVAPPQ